MPRGKSKRKRRGRPSALARMSVTDLVRELDRRKGMLSGLAAERDRLQSELDGVNAQITELESLGVSAPAVVSRRGPGRPPKSARGAKPDGRRGGRGGNADSLPMALHRLLTGRTMGVSEMADAVQKAGYKTKSPNFRTIVNAALLAKPNAGLFKKVARGQYTAK